MTQISNSSTLKAAWQLGLISGDDYQKARDVRSVKGETLPAGRSLSSGEIMVLVSVCHSDNGPAGVRDGAMIGLLWSAGLRRAEVVALKLKDYDKESGELRVEGKGKKERIVWVLNGAREALLEWMLTRGEDDGALFQPINRGGRIIGSRMISQAVYNMLRKRAEQAKIKGFSPHDLRRTFVGDMLDAGADIAVVAKLAGHASINTTARYDRRPEEVKRKAASLRHFPW